MDITAKIYNDEEAAREHLESIRWPEGPVCSYCESDRCSVLGGKSMGPGWFHCNDCRKKFTVRVGTIYERSKIKLHKWVLATHLMASSKKGISAHQLHRMLGVTYKTAWFMAHRIRESMRGADLTPFGSNGGAVEADETFIGRLKDVPTPKGGIGHKMKVLSLLDRETGQKRSVVINDMKVSTIAAVVNANVAREPIRREVRPQSTSTAI
jgi:transposase-like protein